MAENSGGRIDVASQPGEGTGITVFFSYTRRPDSFGFIEPAVKKAAPKAVFLFGRTGTHRLRGRGN